MSDLKRIAALATLMKSQAETVARLTTELAAAKTALDRTEQEDLPDLMSEVGLSSVTLEDGSVVEVSNEIQCGITEERRPAAHEWLTNHDFGGLIKTTVIVAFDRDDREAALDMATTIEKNYDRAVELKEAVHPATLKSFIKERMEGGNAVPFDLFGIRPYNKAKLKTNAKVAGKKAVKK